MDLTDVQAELRTLEEQLANLRGAIEKMKPAKKEAEQEDFERITRLAARNPLVNECIRSAPQSSKTLIFTGLAYFLLAEGSELSNGLLYLCRLAQGCSFETTAEELYKRGSTFEKNDLDVLCRELSEYHYTFLVEALILANLSAEPSTQGLACLADMAEIFHIDQEELQVLALVAKCVLTGNWDLLRTMPVPKKHRWEGKLKEYIPGQWLKKNRHSFRVCIEKFYVDKGSFGENLERHNVKETIVRMEYCQEDHAVLKQGDVICTYTEMKRNKAPGAISPFLLFQSVENDNPDSDFDVSEITQKAPCSGVVRFFIRKEKKNVWIGEYTDKKIYKTDTFTDFYVVSYFDDCADLENQ